jgi:hypothetical protein
MKSRRSSFSRSVRVRELLEARQPILTLSSVPKAKVYWPARRIFRNGDKDPCHRRNRVDYGLQEWPIFPIQR